MLKKPTFGCELEQIWIYMDEIPTNIHVSDKICSYLLSQSKL